MALSQVTMRGIAHHEERAAAEEAEVLHLDDVRVVKMSDEMGITQEVLLFLRVKKVDLEDFDRVRGVQVDMLAQVDIGETTGVKEAEQAIAAELLPGIIVHRLTLLTNIRDNRRIVPKRVDIYGHRTFCLMCPVETASRTG